MNGMHIGMSLEEFESVSKSNACPDGGRTTAQMQTVSTYKGWNTNIWKLTDGEYPKLLWELQNDPSNQ
ncbi:MAG: hypothetical protein K0R14_1964 [Burkholderiales bacterium]|jgi:hypothetical protein|nr:hypothetical protein [Burkholderiales bacterium]